MKDFSKSLIDDATKKSTFRQIAKTILGLRQGFVEEGIAKNEATKLAIKFFLEMGKN